MREARVNVDEVLTAARATHGLANLQQIEHAVLECNGEISISPASSAKG